MMKSAKQAHVSAVKKPSGDSHVSHTSMGMGDYYGTAIKAKLGKVREGMGLNPISKTKIGKPPKSVV